MSYPNKFKNRQMQDLRLGIKSSYNKLRNTIALLYCIYLAEDKKAVANYGVKDQDKQKISDSIRNWISSNIPSIEDDWINNSKLITSQIEAIQVCLELVFGLARVTFNSTENNLSERTGKVRYPKSLRFSASMRILDAIITSHDENTVRMFLSSWLSDTPCPSNPIESKICEFLTYQSEKCVLKMRFKYSADLLFQQEGIYEILSTGAKGVDISDDEKVGTYRVLNSFISEGLHIFLTNSNGEIRLRSDKTIEDLRTYLSEVAVSLDLTENRQLTNDFHIEQLSYTKEHLSKKDELVSLQSNDICSAIRTKPFLLLAGISGTGKSRIVRKLAQATVPKDLQVSFDGKTRTTEEFREERWTLQRPANFELIQVKPNWHNSMDVVGYLSNIPSPHYVFTLFINFIVRAMCHPEIPFFLCLDEMNLAPVEEYFAEFLSAIESRAMDKAGNYMTDPIIPPFHTFGEVEGLDSKKTDVCKDMLNVIQEIINKEGISDERRSKVRNHLEEKGVTLPKNLIIVGTVNMDETTFSFSRKVLDRAMSIEMNKVDYSSFLFDATDDDIKAIAEAYEEDADSTGENNQLNKLLVDRHIEAKEVVEDLGGAAEGSDARFVIDYLETINKLLDGTPFKLGYRAANEALIYLKSSNDFGNLDRNDAIDKFTLMKILSRIEGDESKLRLTSEDTDRLKGCGVDYGKISQERGGATLLSAMREIILNKLRVTVTENPQDNDNIEDAEIEEEETATPSKKEETAPLESIKKLDSMIEQLDRDHFVTYWS